MPCYRFAMSATLLAVQLVSPLRAQNEPTTVALPIVNGVPTASFPSVGMLVQFGRGCTATLIGCQTALTAAHCVCDLLPAKQCSADPYVINTPRFLLLPNAGVFAIASADVDPSYAFPQGDLAVLHLAAPVNGIAPSSINTSGKPGIGTKGTIVGFGYASDSFYGVKGSGLVRLARCGVQGIQQADHDCWRFDQPVGAPGTDSTTCFGDSGGPLFTNTPTGLAIAGVHSAVDTGDDPNACRPPQTGIDADVFVRHDWIIASAAEDLGTEACGGLPAAGTSQAPILSKLVAFSPQARNYRLSFYVAPGTAKLSVAVNAYSNASQYELYVNHGAPANPNRFTCRGQGYHSFKYCEVENPAPGAWNFLATMTQGFGGNAQETVTRFLNVPGPP